MLKSICKYVPVWEQLSVKFNNYNVREKSSALWQ